MAAVGSSELELRGDPEPTSRAPFASSNMSLHNDSFRVGKLLGTLMSGSLKQLTRQKIFVQHKRYFAQARCTAFIPSLVP